MDYIEKIAAKRKAEATTKAEQQKHQESIAKGQDAASLVAAEVARQASKTRTSTQPVKLDGVDVASKQDIDGVIAQLKEVQLASLLGGQQKPSVVLADSTDLGDRMAEIGGQIGSLAKVLTSKQDQKDIQEVGKKLDSIAKELKTLDVAGALESGLDKIREAIAGIELSPVVKVPAPKVTVEAPNVDLSGVERAVESLQQEPDTTVTLAKFVAQDIDNDNSGFQYVGMQNNEGEWCFIENDLQDEKLRYAFGKDNYAKAWAKHNSIEYRLFSEATRAIRP